MVTSYTSYFHNAVLHTTHRRTLGLYILLPHTAVSHTAVLLTVVLHTVVLHTVILHTVVPARCSPNHRLRRAVTGNVSFFPRSDRAYRIKSWPLAV